MRKLLKLIFKNDQKMLDMLDEPPRPNMNDEEFENLAEYVKPIMMCNVIGCKNVVSTYNLLCVEHWKELNRS